MAMTIKERQTNRRKPRIPRGKVRYRELTVDLQTGRVCRGEKDELQLTPAECALFGCLLGRIGRPVTREEMLDPHHGEHRFRCGAVPQICILPICAASWT